MRQAKYFLIILWIGFCVFFSNVSIAGDPSDSSEAVEVIVQGKRYKSILAYKREQTRSNLTRILSSENLREFSEEELCNIIKEVRKRQTADSLPQETLESTDSDDFRDLPLDQEIIEEDTPNLGVSEMKEMLREYLQEHKEADPVLLDPDKVKSIIVEPQK